MSWCGCVFVVSVCVATARLVGSNPHFCDTFEVQGKQFSHCPVLSVTLTSSTRQFCTALHCVSDF